MSKIDVLCAQVGVRVVPVKCRRRGRETHARQVLRKLAAEHGDGHVRFVLRTITESRGNHTELWSETIYAISDVVRLHPDLADQGLAFIEAFDGIPLRELRLQAKTMRIANCRQALGVMLLSRLRLLTATAHGVAIVAEANTHHLKSDHRQSSRAA